MGSLRAKSETEPPVTIVGPVRASLVRVFALAGVISPCEGVKSLTRARSVLSVEFCHVVTPLLPHPRTHQELYTKKLLYTSLF